MRIAMAAPLYESVPPTGYGGTERVVSYLTDELVRRGHEVTLFASGDSQTTARLIAVCPEALRRMDRLTDPVAYHVLQMGLVFERARQFDLVHSHCDFRAFPFAHLSTIATVSTCHNRLDSPELRAFTRAYPDANVTVLSQSHRRQLVGARCVGVTYNGVPVDEFPFAAQPGSYLAFVGRLSPEKGPLEAIEVAERTGIPLKIAAKVNEWERDYFETQIRPRLTPTLVEYVGELGEAEKRNFLCGARALLFPIHWPEPFGLAMIEAMATGTPVLALASGAVPEIVANGTTGYVCRDVSEMAARVRSIEQISRIACRNWVLQKFSTKAMADRYEVVYRKIVSSPRAMTA